MDTELGRNGGQVAPAFRPAKMKTSWEVDEMLRQPKNPARCSKVSSSQDIVISPGLCIHSKSSPDDELKAWRDEAKSWREGPEPVYKSELEQRLQTIYHGALRESEAGHLHPLNYCLGLARAAIKSGAVIYENSRVTEVNTGSNPWAKTEHGMVKAKFMVIAGNAYLGRTVKALYGRVMPVASYIITEPLREPCQVLSPTMRRWPTPISSWIISGAPMTTACCLAGGRAIQPLSRSILANICGRA
jgi:gamma-glutamylputrescine oxidase